jgi:hypothetical protein
MKTGSIVDYCNDTGRYLTDIAKLIFGGAVFAPFAPLLKVRA